MRALLCASWFALLLFVPACNSLSPGQHYTVAKVDRSGLLRPPHTVLEPSTDDSYDEPVGDHFSISLNTGFLRYLQSISSPEVAIFSRVRLRQPGDAGDGFVFQNVFLSSENPDSQIEINKNSSFPRADIALLPAFDYQGEIITLELRVIEIDQEDNARVGEIIKLASNAAALAQPASAMAISTFQSVMEFLVANNSDDIEFCFDLQLAPADEGLVMKRADGQEMDIVLQPRIGTYVVLKTEDPGRINLPSSYSGVVAETLLWGLSRTLRFATLNSLNWFGEPKGDRYSRIFDTPLEVDTASWVLPNFVQDEYLAADMSYFDSGKYERLNPSKQNVYSPFLLTSHQLQILSNGSLEDYLSASEHASRKQDSTPAEPDTPGPLATANPLYRDQSYIVFSITEQKDGISYEEMRAMAALNTSVDDLNLATGKLPIERWREGVRAIRSQVQSLFLERRERDLGRDLERAAGPEERQRLSEQYEQELELLKSQDFLTEIDVARAKSDLWSTLADYDPAATLAVTPALVQIPVRPGTLPIKLTNPDRTEIAGVSLLEIEPGRGPDSAFPLVVTRTSEPDAVQYLELPDAYAEEPGAWRAGLLGSHSVIVQSVAGELSLFPITLAGRPWLLHELGSDGSLALRGRSLRHASSIELRFEQGENVVVQPAAGEADPMLIASELLQQEDGSPRELRSITASFPDALDATTSFPGVQLAHRTPVASASPMRWEPELTLPAGLIDARILNAEGLPPGLRLEPDGAIAGTPEPWDGAWSALFYLRARDEVTGREAVLFTAATTLDMPSPHPVSYADRRLAPTVAAEFELSNAADNPTATRYSIAPALPPGLTLDEASGTISGVPTEPSESAEFAVTSHLGSRETRAGIRLAVSPATE